MQFLADESCDFSIVRALRAAGFEVLAIAEQAPATEDPEVMERAVRESRVLLTEDKDFGQLVYSEGRSSSGVILIRFPPDARQQLPAAILETIHQLGRELATSFVVLSPHKIRIRRPLESDTLV